MQKRKRQENKDQKSYSGIIEITSRRTGFISLPQFPEDILISEENLKNALHGDTVSFFLFQGKKGERREGKVLSIEKRGREEFVGVATTDKGKTIVIADNRRIHTPFLLKEKGGVHDQKVHVRLLPWQDPKKMPEVSLISILGKKGENEAEMRSILIEKGFFSSFPPPVEEEARAIKTKSKNLFSREEKERADFRDTITFTIDPKDAKDFDDALSVKPLKNGNYEIGIHIADVSFYVLPGTSLDKEAQGRGTSVYLVDRTTPMLPEILSNDLCSLNPGEDKLTFSAVFEVDKDARVKKRSFGRSIIRSDKRFTYEEAQKIIDDGKGLFFDELFLLNSLAKKMLEKRFSKGAISFEQDEVKFELDEKGKPLRVFRKERLDTHKLVEEFMLLANKEVAEFVHELGKKKKANPHQLFLYRIHDVPDDEKIAELSLFIKALGHSLPLKADEVTGKDLNALFKQIEGEAEEGMIKTAAIRSMAKAVYSTRNIGHFGLSFDYYTHFTSPIRRYPDVLVHRLLDEYLRGKTISAREFAFYERMATETTEAEIRAAEAERESIKLKQVEFMQNKIGAAFNGVISGITEWGIYVEEKDTKSEGLVKIRDLTPNDYYTLDRKNYRLIGEKTKKTYSLGDVVRFKVTGADLERKTLDFLLL